MGIWKNRAFTRFFISFTVGNIGDWFDIFALQIIFIHSFHAGSVALGFMFLCFFLPMIILKPIAGVWADKYSKRNIMLYTDLVAGLLTILLYLSSGVVEALTLIFIRSCFTTINGPAQQAYVKYVVTEDQLLKASSLTGVVFQLCKVIGPMLGAIVLLHASAKSCLLINAASFFLSVLILLTLKKDQFEKEQLNKKTHWLKDMTTGSQFIWQDRLLRAVVFVMTIWFFCSFVRQAQLALYLKQILPGNQHSLGFFMGLEGLGAVITGGFLSSRKSIKHYFGYFSVGFLLLALGVFFLSLFKPTWPEYIVYVLSLIIGLGTGILLVVYDYLIKKTSPEKLIGRVSSTGSMFGSLALAIGSVLSGYFVRLIGIHELYFVLSVIFFILSILSLLVLKPRV